MALIKFGHLRPSEFIPGLIVRLTNDASAKNLRQRFKVSLHRIVLMFYFSASFKRKNRHKNNCYKLLLFFIS